MKISGCRIRAEEFKIDETGTNTIDLGYYFFQKHDFIGCTPSSLSSPE